jgi:hypothetical protein
METPCAPAFAAVLLMDTIECPRDDKCASTADPIRPVPPMTAIFMTATCYR